MPDATAALVALETRFWEALVAEDADTAAGLLTEPALVVGSHGTLRFDRAEYRRMAKQGPMVLRDFAFRDLHVHFAREDVAILTYGVTQTVAPRDGGQGTVQEMRDSSVWLRNGAGWHCVLHTETPAAAGPGQEHGTGARANRQSGISGSTSRRS